jgi:hypothetical protein
VSVVTSSVDLSAGSEGEFVPLSSSFRVFLIAVYCGLAEWMTSCLPLVPAVSLGVLTSRSWGKFLPAKNFILRTQHVL